MLLSLLYALDWTTILITAAAGLFAYVLLDRFRAKPRLPPQPGLALPVFGHLYKLEPDPRAQFRQWRQQYGDVFSFYLGGTLAIVLNGYSTIKEAFHTRGDEFSNRGKLFLDIATDIPGKGVITSQGPYWVEQKSIVLAILRRLGMGKNAMAERITDEASYFVKRLEDLEGQPQDLNEIINMSFANIIASMLIGQRFDYNDQDFLTLIRHVRGFISYIGSSNILNVYPSLRYIPGDLFKGKATKMHIRGIIELFEERYCKNIDENDSTNISDAPDNIIEAYIQEMNKKKRSGVPTFMDKESLVRIIFDLFIAGTETSSTTLEWALLFVILYPEIQEKLFEEIEREVGTERLPTVHDRNKLVYLNAFIMETQRLGNIAPLGVAHSNADNAKLCGYDIPKGSFIIGNLDSIFTDPKVWGEDVDTFRPERFIDSNGHLINREELIPFSIGKRLCIGESLAVMELFLYMAMLFQRFKFLPADEKNLPSSEPVFGATLRTQSFQIRAVRR